MGNKRLLAKNLNNWKIILKFGVTEVANCDKSALIKCQSLSKTSPFATSLK